MATNNQYSNSRISINRTDHPADEWYQSSQRYASNINPQEINRSTNVQYETTKHYVSRPQEPESTFGARYGTTSSFLPLPQVAERRVDVQYGTTPRYISSPEVTQRRVDMQYGTTSGFLALPQVAERRVDVQYGATPRYISSPEVTQRRVEMQYGTAAPSQASLVNTTNDSGMSEVALEDKDVIVDITQKTYNDWLIEKYQPEFQNYGSMGIPSAQLRDYLLNKSNTIGLKQQNLTSLLKKTDANQDGYITWKEFYDIMQMDTEDFYRQWITERYKIMFKNHPKGLSIAELKEILSDPENTKGLRQGRLNEFLNKLEKKNNGYVDWKTFYNNMIILREKDLNVGERILESLVRHVAPQFTKKEEMIRDTTSAQRNADVLDGEKDQPPQPYIKAYTCIPPPIWIPLISLAQLIVFIVYGNQIWHKNEPRNQLTYLSGIPYWSPAVFNTFYRSQAWRYITYMFIHQGYHHIIFNLLIQLLLGIPLELVHKIHRIAPIYLAGVFGGSLASSVTDSTTMLCGASGGVYALIGAHYANIIINWSEMQMNWLNCRKNPIYFLTSAVMKLILLTIFLIVDVAFALYKRYTTDTITSFAAHFGGIVIGLCLGIPVLKNLHKKSYENVLFWIGIIATASYFVFGVFWNVFYTNWSTWPALEPPDVR